NRTGDVRRASLKPVWRPFERASFQSDTDNHFATAVPRRHRVENLTASVERPHASRSTHFVTRESQEIAAQLSHIDWYMPHALRRIHQRKRADSARFLTKLGHWIDCA